MDSRQVYTGDYFKGTDFTIGQKRQFRICEVKLTKMRNMQGQVEEKLCLRLLNEEKEIALNKGNCQVIQSELGYETELWNGHRIEVTAQIVNSPNGRVPGIVIVRTDAQAKVGTPTMAEEHRAQLPIHQPPPQGPATGPRDEDEIPF